MIADYDDDIKMAEAGRKSVKWKAINTARESIRNLSVTIGNSTSANDIKFHRIDITDAIDELIEALELK